MARDVCLPRFRGGGDFGHTARRPMTRDPEDAVIEKLIRLGEQYDEIRAIILTSTRAAPDAATDVFSDYDPAIYTTDLAPFARSDAWFTEFGPVLVVLRRDWWMPDGQTWDGDPETFTRLVMYEDGTKIDFGIAPVEALRKECQATMLSPGFDVGYRVLIDKDGDTASLKRPTYKAHIPARPTELHYATLVNNFWWDSTYVAKHLWRDDLLPARCMLDHALKQDALLKVLEWSVEVEKGWTWRPGRLGKGLKKVLDAETYDELVNTYVGGNIGELWDALFRTTALFRRTATNLGSALGYEYLHDLDRRVTIYLRTVRQLPDTATGDDLANLLRSRYDTADR
jgi:aminoglycoside 6-adenylyltransferase